MWRSLSSLLLLSCLLLGLGHALSPGEPSLPEDDLRLTTEQFQLMVGGLLHPHHVWEALTSTEANSSSLQPPTSRTEARQARLDSHVLRLHGSLSGDAHEEPAMSEEERQLARQNLVVDTLSGPVVGHYDLINGMALWKGIPYAAAPVDTLRWAPPQPVAAWTEPRNAWSRGPLCAQVPYGVTHLGREDCLYLNIHAPTDFRGKRLPVVVWIHGGGWVAGDAWSLGFYDPKHLMKHLRGEFVFVSFNYRLGAFGFMALDELRRESPQRTAGNYGLLDQVQVLRWIRQNIAGFGGNPAAVTIVGESAGAFSVCWHLGAELSRGLFHRAIMQSVTCDSPDLFSPFEHARAFSEAVGASVGCRKSDFEGRDADYLRCLRATSTNKLVNAPVFNGSFPVHPPRRLAPAMPWAAAIDGSVTLRSPFHSFRLGQWNRVPVIAGFNRDEGSLFLLGGPLFVPGLRLPLHEEGLRRLISHFLDDPEAVRTALEQVYPPNGVETPGQRGIRFLTDHLLMCPTRRAMRAMSDSGANPVYLYEFGFDNAWPDRVWLGAYHMAELVYTFRHAFPEIPVYRQFWSRDWQIADAVNAYWHGLAATGKPNALNSNGGVPVRVDGEPMQPPEWPVFVAGADERALRLDLPLGQTANNPRRRECDFFDSLL